MPGEFYTEDRKVQIPLRRLCDKVRVTYHVAVFHDLCLRQPINLLVLILGRQH